MIISFFSSFAFLKLYRFILKLDKMTNQKNDNFEHIPQTSDSIKKNTSDFLLLLMQKSVSMFLFWVQIYLLTGGVSWEDWSRKTWLWERERDVETANKPQLLYTYTREKLLYAYTYVAYIAGNV